MEPLDFASLEAKLKKKLGVEKISETDVMSAALYPKVAEDFFQNRSGSDQNFTSKDFLFTLQVLFDGKTAVINIPCSFQGKVGPCRQIIN